MSAYRPTFVGRVSGPDRAARRSISTVLFHRDRHAVLSSGLVRPATGSAQQHLVVGGWTDLTISALVTLPSAEICTRMAPRNSVDRLLGIRHPGGQPLLDHLGRNNDVRPCRRRAAAAATSATGFGGAGIARLNSRNPDPSSFSSATVASVRMSGSSAIRSIASN